MDFEHQKNPAISVISSESAPNADTQTSACPNIEMVDIKTEPPDLSEPVEYSDKSPALAESAINLRIETVESKAAYETAGCAEPAPGIVHKEVDVDTSDLPKEVKSEETMEIKQEVDTGDVLTPEISISYDIPIMKQADSSVELTQPEGEDLRRSLQEEIVLKVEMEDVNGEVDCPREEVLEEYSIKIEQPASDSQMVPKNILSTEYIDGDRSGITMKILPMETTPEGFTASNEKASDNVSKIRLSSQSTPDQMTQLHVYNSDFQLNSITGDMLSLEQEAYGLLEAKNQTTVVAHPYTCSKCPKTCKDKSVLKRHMKVHETIERRADGIARGKKTRELNKTKKEINLMKIGTSKDLIPYHYTRTGEPRKGDFRCTGCKKEYRVLKCLRRHQRMCTELKVEAGVNEPRTIKREDRKSRVNEPRTIMREDRKNRVKRNSTNKPINEGLRKEKEQPIMRRRDNEEYKCECGKTFNRRSPMETCLRSHHPELESQTYSCTVCTKSFNLKSELIQHKKRQHVKKKYLCKFCPMDYHTPKELFDHLRVHKKVQMMEFKVISEIVKGKQVLKCFICQKTFAELSDLKGHVLVDHKEPYTCPHCQKNFSKIVDFATHTKSAHPEVEGQSVLDVLESVSILAQAWKCEDCHVQFEDPDELVKHQTEQHGPTNKKPTENSEESSKFQFRCEDCRRTFITLKQLSIHRNLHHTIKDQNVSRSDDTETVPERVATPPPPLPMCVHCRKVCKDEATLTSHLRLHSMDRKYPCKFCDFRFATVEKRKNHAIIHTGDLKYVCFICEYRCSSENRLQYHKQTPKHLDMKHALLNGLPYEPQVPILQPEVKRKRHSSERKKLDSPDEPSACDVCGEQFPNERSMLTHKDTHPFIVFPNEDEPKRIFFK